MTQGLKDFGENRLLITNMNGNLDVGLFLDSDTTDENGNPLTGDDLSDSQDDASADITTEPDTSEDYARQTVPFSVTGSTLSNNSTIQFPVSANDEIINACFVTEAGTDKIIFTLNITERNLDPLTIEEIENIEVTLD